MSFQRDKHLPGHAAGLPSWPLPRGHCAKPTVLSLPLFNGGTFPSVMLAEVQPRSQPARTQGRAWLPHDLHSNCSRNPRGSWSNNHRAHYKISNAVPQIYIRLPPVWKDDPLLLLCQGSRQHQGAAVCIVLLLLFPPGSCVLTRAPAEGSLCSVSAGAGGAQWTSGKQPLCFFSLRVLLSHSCYEMYSKTQKFTWCQNQEEEE